MNLIEQMQCQIDSCKKHGDPENEASWGDQHGVLISVESAGFLIFTLQSAMTWKKYPEEGPEESKDDVLAFLLEVEIDPYKKELRLANYDDFKRLTSNGLNITHFAEIKQPGK